MLVTFFEFLKFSTLKYFSACLRFRPCMLTSNFAIVTFVIIFLVYLPEEQKEAHGEVRKTPSPPHDEPDDDYLGENVNYDIHE